MPPRGLTSRTSTDRRGACVVPGGDDQRDEAVVTRGFGAGGRRRIGHRHVELDRRGELAAEIERDADRAAVAETVPMRRGVRRGAGITLPLGGALRQQRRLVRVPERAVEKRRGPAVCVGEGDLDRDDVGDQRLDKDGGQREPRPGCPTPYLPLSALAENVPFPPVGALTQENLALARRLIEAGFGQLRK